MTEEKHILISHPDNSVFEGKILSRRELIKKLALSGGSLVLLAGCGVHLASVPDKADTGGVYAFIAVDYTKCTGCRTCEAVCAASNHPEFRDGNYRSDVGNPIMANIQVHNFNPDVSAPAVCARCPDTPCVKACPEDPEPKTGRRPLYQDPKLGVIRNDPERCVGCGSCVDACTEKSVGILYQNPKTDFPMRMCTLCDGKPQCVAHCPYEAMSILRVNADYAFYRMSPRDIANELNKRWYNIS
ncbi:MAG: 4Fe-4S dicluster domain-containing protein [Proteobacteria bacterium]|nr:4Fe-4S dicluster domain-containing protein [Pseudomonadota bacterium]